MKKFRLSKPKFSFKMSPRKKKFLIGTGIGTLVFAILLVIFVVLPLINIYKSGKVLVASARELKDSTSSQDINVMQSKLEDFKGNFSNFESSYNHIAWMHVLPFVGGYVSDGTAGINAGKYAIETAEIGIETLKPYADIIGLAKGSGDQTANDRIEFVVKTIHDVLPKIDEISQKVNMIQSEVAKIDENRYPEEFRGMKVRSQIANAKDILNQGAALLSESKPLLEKAPYLLGTDGPRKYLLIFQNDKELRPTGGFFTGYSIAEVTNGKFNPVKSSDIYDLDSKYTPSVEAPEPLRQYLKGPYLISKNYRLRDMNWSPDFQDSITLFLQEAKKAGLEDVDGVIAVDTQVVVNLLDVLGEIDVPGYGKFSTNIDPRCDCPQVIYELEDFADVEGAVVWNQDGSGEIIYAPKNYGKRKEIIGPLMNSVLSNALGQPKEKIPALFEAGLKSLTEKHVLLYLTDEQAQSGAVGANFAGTIDTTHDGDYLNINDANLGGRKSNLYVDYEIAQDVEIAKDGTTTKTLNITYKNTKDQDGWLNSILPNWTRVYVPEGSELIDSSGFDKDTQTYSELGKTVFAGGFELRPNGIKNVMLKYKLPMKFNSEYSLYIQKQAGKDDPLYSITVNKNSQDFYLKTDRELKFKI